MSEPTFAPRRASPPLSGGPLRTVIVDDEPLALDRLAALLTRVGGVEIVGRATGCTIGAALIARTSPDLVILDIKMRDGTAFDLLVALPNSVAPLVAFATAYPRFACQAFEVEAVDYLLKPVEFDRLEALVGKAIRQRDLMTAEDRVSELQLVIENLRSADVGASPTFERELWIRDRGSEHLRVPVTEIDWIDWQADYSCIHANGHEHLLRASLDRLMRLLDPKEFVRIHRSTVVRADRVMRVRHKSRSVRECVLVDGTVLPIGRVHARNLAWSHAGAVGHEPA